MTRRRINEHRYDSLQAIEAQNERQWAEFNAKTERLEAEHQQAMAKIDRRSEFQRRMINVVLGLQVVALIITYLLAPD